MEADRGALSLCRKVEAVRDGGPSPPSCCWLCISSYRVMVMGQLGVVMVAAHREAWAIVSW